MIPSEFFSDCERDLGCCIIFDFIYDGIHITKYPSIPGIGNASSSP